MFIVSIGEKIQKIRKSLGFSSREKFAEELNIPFATLRAYEQGKIENIPHSFINTLASKFNVNINWLMSDNGDMFVQKDTFTQHGSNNQQIGTQTNIQTLNNLSAYFHALESVAIATEKRDELVDDIKMLIGKYIGGTQI